MKRLTRSLREFCDKQELLRLSYLDGDGYPRVIPLWFARVGGDYCVGTGAASPKWKSMLKDPRVGWVVDGGKRAAYKGLSMKGRAVEITDKRRRAAVHRALGMKYFRGVRSPAFLEIYGEAGDPQTAYFKLAPEDGFFWEY
jgi:nitroimidazol reductase NimA-like FMN-containing flavoprotein (pyridoxamine 5'-phosphate oxidase superfamily)